jgi:hypothetical protein
MGRRHTESFLADFLLRLWEGAFSQLSSLRQVLKFS